MLATSLATTLAPAPATTVLLLLTRPRNHLFTGLWGLLQETGRDRRFWWFGRRPLVEATIADSAPKQMVLRGHAATATLCRPASPPRATTMPSATHAVAVFAGGNGLALVLARVCGGPVALASYDPATQRVELWFMTSSDARRFHVHASSNMFVVNGVCVRLALVPEKESAQVAVCGDMVRLGARRVVVLKQTAVPPGCVRSTASSRHQPFGELDPAAVRRQFEPFGQVVLVSPMVLRRLCFAVHYASVTAAMAAMAALNDATSDLARAYHGWLSWYGTDPCDRVPLVGDVD